MIGTLVWKLLRDIRVPLLVVMVLLAAFQCLWAKITQRIIAELLPAFTAFMPLGNIKTVLFEGPGKLMQTFMGGESIQLNQVRDMLSIGVVHPLMQTVFCVWAIGRAAVAISGEIDRGTMELLVAQPVARWKIIIAHAVVDLMTIPLLCLSLWLGHLAGASLMGMLKPGEHTGPSEPFVQPLDFLPGLINVAALLFAVSGYTMWLSARGRFRGRVMGIAVLVTLLQFLVNVVGQLWDTVEPFRQFTVFYYFQPQQIILANKWTVGVGKFTATGQPLFAVNAVAVLAGVGLVGYALALWSFCRRDLPAPL